MSFTASNWAWDQHCPSSAAKLVLLCLAEHATQTGERAFPSIGTICRRTQLAERTVRKALVDLTKYGLVKRHDRKHSCGRQLSAEYRLEMRDAPLANMQETHPGKYAGDAPNPPLADMQESTLADMQGSTLADMQGSTLADMQEPTLADVQESPLQICNSTPANLQGNPVIEPRKEERSLLRSESSVSPSMAVVFALFWSIYPRKVGKRKAADAFGKACKRADPTAIVAALRAQVEGSHFSADPHYQPHPTTWLNEDRWADDASVPSGPRSTYDIIRESLGGYSHIFDDDTPLIIEGRARS